MKFCNSNLKYYTFPLATALCIALSGCGGGDDSGTPATSTTNDSGDPLTGVVITESNMADVAAAVIMSTAASDIGASGAGSNSNFVLGVETTAAPVAAIPAPASMLMNLVVDQAKRASSNLDAQAVVVGVESSQTVPCHVSGSQTYTYDRQDPSGTFVAGDVINVSFSECHDGIHLLNGIMQMTVNSFSGFTDPISPAGSMDVSAVFTNLIASGGQTSLTMDGGMNVAATISGTVDSIMAQASSINYVLERNGVRMSMTLKNLNQKMDDATDRFEMVVSEDFSASFPTFSGSGRVTTLLPVVSYWGANGYAGTTGKLKVAADSSALYITLQQDAGSAYLELDSDNDGMIDASVTKTLVELDLLADLFP